MHELVASGLLGHGCTEVLPARGIGQNEQGDNERGTKQRPQDGAERIRQELEAVVDPSGLADAAVLLGAVFVDLRATRVAAVPLVLTGRVDARLFDNGLVVVGDAATHDDLVSVLALVHGAEDGLVRFERLLVDLGRIGKLETQARRAVRQRRDVVSATNIFDDVLRGIFGRCHGVLLFIETYGDNHSFCGYITVNITPKRTCPKDHDCPFAS